MKHKKSTTSPITTGLTRRNFLKFASITGITMATSSSLLACSKESGSSSGESHSDSQPTTHTLVDMNGTTVEVPTTLTKYADGWYAHNEITLMLTGAEGLVATHCSPKDFPWMYKVGSNMNNATTTFGDDFNFEDLVALEPQVIFDSNETLRDKCNEIGIPLINCNFQTFDQMKKSIELSGAVFGGNAPAIAAHYNAELDEVLSDIKAKTDKLSASERPGVMHGNSVYTLNLDGTGVIIDDWIKTAGGKNAVTESTKGTAAAKFSLEQIITWNPDVIITGKPTEVDQILNDPNWSSLNAVKNKRVYVNPKGVFGWSRFGVEELLQIQWAAALLHPDLFPHLDIDTKVKDFYRTYFNYTLSDNDVKLILAAENPK